MDDTPNPLTTWIEDPAEGPAPRRPKVSLESVDQARAWMCYAAFSGDLEKTAIASKVPLAALVALEHDFNWVAKLKRLKTGAGESDAERVANRAVNYLQAQRMRDVLEDALRLLSDPEELLRQLVKFKFAADGAVERIDVNPKAVLDLAKALETVQNMSYRALGDKIPTAAETVNSSDRGTSAASVISVRSVISALTEMQERDEEDKRARKAQRTKEANTDGSEKEIQAPLSQD